MKLPPGHFHGQTLSTRTIAGFELMETVYRPGTTVPKHSHTHGCFSIMTGGAMTETYGRRNLEWTRSCVGFNPPDEEHSNIIHNTGARFFIVDIGKEWLELARENSAKLDNSVLLRGKAIEYLGLQLYREVKHGDEVSPLAVEGLVLSMLAEASRCSADFRDRHPPRWLERVKECLDAQFTHPPATHVLALEAGRHPVHLSAMFRKYYRCSPGQYVRQLRLSNACRKLAETEIPIAEIALVSGFYDQSHFTRLFKEFTGLSPARYRMTLRTS